MSRSSATHPTAWLVAVGALTIPAAFGLSGLALDTNLIELIPNSSRASQATRDLDRVVGGASFATIVFEGGSYESKVHAVRATAATVADVPGVASVEFEYPLEFISKYRYLLIPAYYLEQVDQLLAPRRPEVEDSETAEPFEIRQNRKDILALIQQYRDLPRYHQTPDSSLMGMIIRTSQGITSVSQSRALFKRLEEVAADASTQFGLSAGVSGSLRNKVDEFDLITSDLKRSGTIALIAILVTLVLSFRSVRVLPIVLLPLGVGLIWAFALVPLTVGNLNLITSFLLVVMFGMGVDYAIHLVKRYQQEIAVHPPHEALRETFRSTGTAVTLSGLTTALALFILIPSDFRGFSEFGIVGGVSILVVLIAMAVTMPAALTLGHKLGMVPVRQPSTMFERLVPSRVMTAAMVVVLVAAGVWAVRALGFDYDFNNLRFTVDLSNAANDRSRTLYTASRSPAAVFVAPNLATLDSTLAVLEVQRDDPNSSIGRLASVRDFAPDEDDLADRLQLIDENRRRTRGLRALLMGREIAQLATDLRGWPTPSDAPTVGEIPAVMKLGLVSAADSSQLLLAVYPRVERRDGRNAMAFTNEIYGLELPGGIRGPVGETPVLSEILWLVTTEGPWLVGFTFAGIVLMVMVTSRSIRQSLWMVTPLIAGLSLTAGLMVVLGLKLNFFNIVIIPALLGLGVDHGVHYYRRWRETGRDVQQVQSELLGPLSVCTATTVMGYVGMIGSSHMGLRSMGLVAVLGLGCIWVSSVALFPGLLRWIGSRSDSRMVRGRGDLPRDC